MAATKIDRSTSQVSSKSKKTGAKKKSPAKPAPKASPAAKGKVIDRVNAGGGIMVDVVERKAPAVDKAALLAAAANKAKAPKPEPKPQPKPEPATKAPAPLPVGDGPQPYRLEGSDRVELLTPEHARVRNLCRKDAKWVPAPDVDPSKAKAPAKLVSGEERKRLEAAGRQKDRAAAAKQTPAPPAAADKPQQSESKPQQQPKPSAASGGGKLVKWQGHSAIGLLRWLGKREVEREAAVKVLGKLGMSPSPATVAISLSQGKRNDRVPEVRREQQQELEKLVKEAK